MNKKIFSSFVFLMVSIGLLFGEEMVNYRFQFQVGMTPENECECSTGIFSFYVMTPDGKKYASEPVTLIAADSNAPSIRSFILDIPEITEQEGNFSMGVDLLKGNGKLKVGEENNFIRGLVLSPSRIPVFEKSFYSLKRNQDEPFAYGNWTVGEVVEETAEPYEIVVSQQEICEQYLEYREAAIKEVCKEDYFRTYFIKERLPKSWR